MKTSSHHRKAQPMHLDLKGPFSPFTLALQSIQGKVLYANREAIEITNDYIDMEYLEHIISLSIPLYDEQGAIQAAIQFPAAVCEKKNKKLTRHAGQFDRSNDSESEMKIISKSLEHYVSMQKSVQLDRLKYVSLLDVLRGQAKQPTQYPQNIRRICGFFKTSFNNSFYYIFISCSPIDDIESCHSDKLEHIDALCKMPGRLIKDMHPDNLLELCCGEVVNTFCEYFLSDHHRHTLDRLCQNSQRKSQTETGDDSFSHHTGSYPILRETLSNIQAEAIDLASHKIKDLDGSQQEAIKKMTFSMAFVMPSLTKDEQHLCFRYLLTHQQIQFLNAILPIDLERMIHAAEKQALTALREEVQKNTSIKLHNLERIRDIAQTLVDKIITNNNGIVASTESNMKIEEYLRNAIYLDYTFRESSKSQILQADNLAAYMQSDKAVIGYKQTFLIDEIIKNRHPEVMMSMINHPFSKMKQFQTSILIKAYESDYEDNIFYPAGLNLMEALFLPSSMYLNPIYQHNVPLLLCAFDTKYYLGHWQAIKGMLEAHKDGMFSEMVSHEQNEAKKYFDTDPNIVNLNANDAARDFASMQSYLALRFCPDLDVIYHHSLRPAINPDSGVSEDEISLPTDSADGFIQMGKLDKKICLSKRLANKSVTANRYWHHFINMHLSDFYGAWNNAQEAKENKARILQLAIRSAVAAIVSRNHSHHIGSHVTPRTSHEKILSRLDELKFLGDKLTQADVAGFLKYRLDRYIQKKADFLSEIVTEPLTTTVTALFFSQTIMGFIENTLLLDNIGANEGIKYRTITDNRLKIHVRIKGEEVEPRLRKCDTCNISRNEYPYSGHCLCAKTPRVVELEGSRADDRPIAFPGPLGEYALYAFLENFIRNACKHNQKIYHADNKLNLNVAIDLDEYDPPDPHYYRFRIRDNVSLPKNDLMQKLTEHMEARLVDDQGILIKEGWGMAEMKIMATLLAGSNDFSDMSSNLKLYRDENDGHECITYELRLMKPKELAILSKRSFQNADQCRLKGIQIFESAQQLVHHQMSAGSKAGFNFVIVDKGIDDFKPDDVRLCPSRVLVHKEVNLSIPGMVSIDDTFVTNLLTQAPDDMIGTAWRQWVRQFPMVTEKERITNIALYFMEYIDGPITTGWKEYIDKKHNKPSMPEVSIICNGPMSQYIYPQIDPSKDTLNWAIYDRHFLGYSALEDPKIGFHEAFDKNSFDFVPITSAVPDDIVVCRLAESVMLKVLVIDERIAEVAHQTIVTGETMQSCKEVYGSNARLDVARLQNTYLATHLQIDDDQLSPLHVKLSADQHPRIQVEFSMNSDRKTAESIIVKIVSQDGSQKIVKPHVLIMHQSILENYFKNNGFKDTDFSMLIDSIRSYIPFVFIDSGRGIPANLTPDVKFMPFSLMQNYFMHDRLSKFSLTSILMNLTRRGQS